MEVVKRSLTQSDAWWQRAVKVIPSGTQTLSKAPNQFVNGVAPKYLSRGNGSHVWDVDGNEYIDYPMALGPILLGYDYPPVTEAVINQIRLGTTFTLMHPLEVEVAELLTELIPCAEMVRFGKNGVDATTGAVRIARAYTGRDHIAYCGYHGYQDWYAIVTERNKGIPQVYKDFMHSFTYNDIGSLRKIFDEYPAKIAAVIFEQPLAEPEKEFLTQVRKLTQKYGSIFIWDEIVTGFRYALGGAQEYYNVIPDLACFGKGMANGYPISAVVGRKELMQEFEHVFFSTTYGGETVSLSATKATINVLKSQPVIPYIWTQGKKLRDGITSLAKDTGINLVVKGNPPRSWLSFYDEQGNESLLMKSLFLQETVKRGILFGGPVFLTYSHTDEDVRKTLSAVEDALLILKKAVSENQVDRYLEGEPIGLVFRPQIR